MEWLKKCWMPRVSKFSTREAEKGSLVLILLFFLINPCNLYSSETPPAISREFRGVWVASVGNINWPSKPGLSSAQQQRELTAIFDLAARTHLNAVILQVRPLGDAFYASPTEPWSPYLTGTMGKPPSPYYDPLEFAVLAAHSRGLELHAWINPYRAGFRNSKYPLSENHFIRRHPHLIRSYGKNLWMDPGEVEVQNHVVQVITHLVKNYDLDGIHLDDYFYPYPEKTSNQTHLEFPDEKTYSTYQKQGGKLAKNDWRRHNVNGLIERLYQTIKSIKPEVRFGISPFGIWRPGYPAQIRGLDAYDGIYADARLWLNKGWVDYMAPQLYWGFDQPAQDFGVLHTWWLSQNTMKRHIWPGLNAVKVGQSWSAANIIQQVNYSRRSGTEPGVLMWNIGSLQRNSENLATQLSKKIYPQPALPPSMPWIQSEPPPTPSVQLNNLDNNRKLLNWNPSHNSSPAQWVLQSRRGKLWNTEILPAHITNRVYVGVQQVPDAIALYSVGRGSIVSAPILIHPKNISTRKP